MITIQIYNKERFKYKQLQKIDKPSNKIIDNIKITFKGPHEDPLYAEVRKN